MDNDIKNNTGDNNLQSQDTQLPENDNISVTSKEIASYSLDSNTVGNGVTLPATSNEEHLLLIKGSTPVIQKKPSFLMASAFTRPLKISTPITPISINVPNIPQTLFLQALAKLNASSLSLASLNLLDKPMELHPNAIASHNEVNENINTPPNSLTSAPPSYAFVLRQIAARQRPRLMGTFIPSPSYIQHTPPPNYAAAFDIYVDNPVHRAPQRVYNFGFTPMPIICPECGHAGLTVVATKITLCTHLCAMILCLFCCWVCAPLPYVLRSCKDVYHYCRNCRRFLGMYCPSNPENAYT